MADGSIHIDTHLDDSGLKSGIEKMKGTVSKGFSALGSLAVKGLTAATAATATFVVAATKAGIDFESAFAGVKKTVDATDEELAQLRTGILDMSKEIPLAANEIAGIAEAAGQLGIKTENLLGFTEVMANLGVSTNMSADEAATALARLANITQMPQDQFDRLGSTVVALGNNFATTESEIVDMALRLAGTGSQVGLTEDQILSFSAALSSVGLQAELGGSAFSRVFKMMQLATETEGEALEAFAAVAGMSASEFKRAFEEDAASAMIAFVAGLGNAEQHGMTAIGVLENMSAVEGLSALSTVAVSDALLRAAGSSEVMAEALQVGSQAWEENTALTNEASQRYETLESKIQLLKNTATAFMITMSDSWRDTCAEFVSAGTQMIASLDAAFQSGGINGLVEALGPALEQAVTLILSYVPRFMEVAVQILSGLAQGILNNLPLLTQAAVQVITQLVTGFVNALPQMVNVGVQILSILAHGITSALPQLTSVAVQAINNFASSIHTGAGRVSQSGTSVVQALLTAITDSASQLLSAGVNLIGRIAQGIANGMPSLVTQASKVITTLGSSISKALPTLLQAGVSIIKSLVQGITQMIPSVAQVAVQILSSLTKTITSNSGSFINTALDLIENFADQLIENIPQVLKAGLEMMKGLVKGIAEGLPTLIERVPTIVSKFASIINDNAPTVLKAGVEMLITLGKGIISAIPTLVKNIPQIVKAIFDVWKAVNWLDLGKKVITGLINGIKSLLGSVTNIAKNLGDTLTNAVSYLPNKFLNIGKNIISGLWNGIKNSFSSLASKVSGLFSDLVGGIKSMLGIHSPSKLFEKVIGKNIGLGVKVGIEDTQPKVSKAMNNLVDPEKATARVSRMKSSVSDHVSSMTRSASTEASKVIVSGSSDSPTPEAIAEAIWDKAPPMEVDLDGEKVGSMIEPKVSKIQAKKTESMNRRNGIVTA